MLAKDIMTRDVITVYPDTPVDEVIRILTEKKISGMPVVDQEDRVIGVVTEGDILVRNKKLHFPSYLQFLAGVIYLESLKKFEEEIKKAIGVRVEDVMTKDVITASADTPIGDLATLMVESQINRIPILDDEKKLVGIVSRADIIKANKRD